MTGKQSKALAIRFGIDDVSSSGSGGRPPKAHSDLVTAFITSARNKLRLHFNDLTDRNAPEASTNLKAAVRRTEKILDLMTYENNRRLLLAAAIHFRAHKLFLNP